MRITSFEIENFRNLQYAQCSQVPDFMVICGGNGCGKSALLEALMTAKEHAAAYGYFSFDPRVVSSIATKARIAMTLAFSEQDRLFVKERFNEECPEQEEIIIEINKDGGVQVVQRSDAAYQLLSFYGRSPNSPGFFDYINAHRFTQKLQLQSWDASFLSDQLAKQTLTATQNKFQHTKQYLAGLKMRDLQALQTFLRTGAGDTSDSLQDIRDFFDNFFAPMTFKDVLIDKSPFEFVVSTPSGDIDIDDMSSGEKEIFNLFTRFHQLQPRGSVILFDEADAHLHPDLERRYLEALRKMAKGNQLLLTTHSPEMMMAAGTESLYTILKEPQANRGNQLVRVTESQHLHQVLSELMGSRGLVSLNQRIIFIEGESASADRAIYEAYYPPNQYNISFVPAGDSSTVRRTAEQVNALLTAGVGFQQYFSIVDRDIIRSEPDPTSGTRLFRLPVYHVENFLLDANEILEVSCAMLGAKCPYNQPDQVRDRLQSLVLSDAHLKPYARALLDSRVAAAAKEAYDAVFKRQPLDGQSNKPIEFSDVEIEAKALLEETIRNNTWRESSKGRDLLKAYCVELKINYEHFRNSLVARLKTPPTGLDDIMRRIIAA